MTYATEQEILDYSARVSAVTNASTQDITIWSTIAKVHVDQFCQQDFSFESQASKLVRKGTNPMIYLSKIISGDISALDVDGEAVDPSNFDVYEDAPYLRYSAGNTQFPSTDQQYFTVTADWGYAESFEALAVAFSNQFSLLYTDHIVSTEFHTIVDEDNGIAESDAEVLDTAIVLLNDVKAKFNAHVVDTDVHLVAGDTVDTPSATDEASFKVLAAALKTAYNDHIADTDVHVAEDTVTLSLSVTNTVLPMAIKIAFIRIVQRLAIRDNQEDIRQQNSGYTNESYGDGYSYNLSNGSLRALIQPSDAALLWPFVNHGQVVV